MTGRFRVKTLGTWYKIETVTTQQAVDFGATSATHKITSLRGHGEIWGRFIPQSGLVITVPGTSEPLAGVAGKFITTNEDSASVLQGHLIVDVD
jgi:hypothetical protein